MSLQETQIIFEAACPYIYAFSAVICFCFWVNDFEECLTGKYRQAISLGELVWAIITTFTPVVNTAWAVISIVNSWPAIKEFIGKVIDYPILKPKPFPPKDEAVSGILLSAKLSLGYKTGAKKE
jgi:hypothetical protein